MYTKPVQKWAHICLTTFGAIYLSFVFLVKGLVNVFYHNAAINTPQPIVLFLLCVILFFCFAYAVLHLSVSRSATLFQHNKIKGKLSPVLFLSVFATVSILYIVYLAAHYPGGFSPDTALQWQQAHTMEFTDHHPVFHTFFFAVLTKIWDSYTFLLLVQIATFACALAYLAATMHAWGFRLPLVLLLCAFIAIATPSRNIVMFFWKDTALSIFFLFFISHIFNIMLSNGEWLKKPSHRIASAVLLACITLVRHNAVLLTAPMLVLMLFYLADARRACMKLTVLVLFIVVGVKGPLYSAFNVVSTEDSYLETTGLPMTILFSNYVYAPNSMPAQAYELLEQFTDRETAIQNYEFGNYNSIKWYLGEGLEQATKSLEETPILEFIGMTLETIKDNTLLAVRSVLELTDMVWDPVGNHYHLQEVPFGEPSSYIPIPAQLSQASATFYALLDSALSGPIFQKFTSQLGVLILVMLLACYISIHRFRGWSCLWIILPIMCYNFGTMLLLSGPDYRFFHFNCLAAYPLAILLLSKPRKAENETCIQA